MSVRCSRLSPIRKGDDQDTRACIDPADQKVLGRLHCIRTLLRHCATSSNHSWLFDACTGPCFADTTKRSLDSVAGSYDGMSLTVLTQKSSIYVQRSIAKTAFRRQFDHQQKRPASTKALQSLPCIGRKTREATRASTRTALNLDATSSSAAEKIIAEICTSPAICENREIKLTRALVHGPFLFSRNQKIE